MWKSANNTTHPLKTAVVSGGKPQKIQLHTMKTGQNMGKWATAPAEMVERINKEVALSTFL
jgi:hypothetical protein